MVRKLIIACAVMGLSLGVVQAEDAMMGDKPPMHPEVILGPPEGFEPPEDMPPPPMDDPEATKERIAETARRTIDAVGHQHMVAGADESQDRRVDSAEP